MLLDKLGFSVAGSNFNSFKIDDLKMDCFKKAHSGLLYLKIQQFFRLNTKPLC